MNYPTDPGKRFASDFHRRVLGHLPHPTDNYGWTAPALHVRMWRDPTTEFESHEDIQPILDELESQGHAERVQVNNKDVWRQTQQGFETLQLGLPDEPRLGDRVEGPAVIGLGAASSAATLIPTPQTAENPTAPETPADATS